MKAEITLPDDLAALIAAEVATALKPLLSARKATEDPILDPDQLAAYLGVTRGWVYEAASQKTIPYAKVGKFLRFRKSAIDKWLEAQATPAARAPSRTLRVVGGDPTR